MNQMLPSPIVEGDLTVPELQSLESATTSTSAIDKRGHKNMTSKTSKPLSLKSKVNTSREEQELDHNSNGSACEMPQRGIVGRIRAYYLQAKATITRSGRRNSAPNFSLPLGARAASGKPGSYRRGLLTATITCGMILLANITFTAWISATSKNGIHMGIISNGDLWHVTRANTVLHLIINALSILLLASSNYTMQLLSAPTRVEVDQAHCLGQYLNIGILSMRNLSFGEKGLLFMLLLISSLPISLLWNSAIFVTSRFQDLNYYGFLVTDEFFEQTTVDCTESVKIWSEAESTDRYYPDVVNGTLNTESESPLTYCHVLQGILNQYHAQGLINLSKTDCIGYFRLDLDTREYYANDFLAVTHDPRNQTVLEGWSIGDESWLCISTLAGEPWDTSDSTSCLDPANLEAIKANSTWNVGFESLPADYCLVMPPKEIESCVQCSIIIMLAIIACNAVKFTCCIFTLSRLGKCQPLVTIGDAVSTFLDSPDPITSNICLLDKYSARNIIQTLQIDRSKSSRWIKSRRKSRWFQAPQKSRWYTTIAMTVLSLAALYCGLAKALRTVKTEECGEYGYTECPAADAGELSYEFARTVAVNIFPWANNPTATAFSSEVKFMAMVTFANAPQLVISYLYFLYNGVFTSIACAVEWTRLTTTRKALRTTESRGLQRSTYWLSLPWKWALPLHISGFLIHWLASQSFRYERSVTYDLSGRLTETGSENSTLAIVDHISYHFALAVLGTIIIFLTIGLGFFRTFPEGLLVGSNSLAISAACHPPSNDKDAAFLAIQWGAVNHETEAGPGHCCFSSQKVEMPREGGWYQ